MIDEITLASVSDADRVHLLRLDEELTSQGRRLARTELPLIVPVGDPAAFALDSQGQVVGLKFGTPHDPNAILGIIVHFEHLQRLVLSIRQESNVDLPDELADLSGLRFLWLSGNIRRIPERLLLSGRQIVGTRSESPGSQELEKSLEAAIALTRRCVQIHSREERDADQGRSRETENWEILSLEDRAALSRLEREVRGIFLADVKLEDPPLEIVLKGSEAIATYFRELEVGSLQLNELKVLLVGHGSCGKTSLVKRLFGEQFNPRESQTHGINIRSLKMGSKKTRRVKANFWDFGGQEIMHATHQFFLSKRSLYVLVLDGRKEEDAEYWLQHIQSFGGDSPVMIVLNKIDDNPSFDVNRRFLKEKFPQISGYHRTSCATSAGIADFRRELETLVSNAPVLQTSWPKSWFNVKKELENLSADHISVDEYNKICSVEGIEDPKSRDALVDFLHDLGVILHFRDLQLEDTHVLDPRWVTEGVYRIVNSDLLAAQQGLLRLNQLGKIFQSAKQGGFRYTPDKYDYIVQLMLKFELCYRISDTAILIPDLLDIQEPDLGFEPEGPLRFVLDYAYLPKSVLPKFMVRMHHDIHKSWRTGVVLDDRSIQTRALIRADEKAKRIYISVTGSQKRDYFSVIRKVFSDINGSFEKLKVVEKVPLPDVIDEEIEYKELIGHEIAQRDEVFVGRVGRSYSVRKLLSGIEERPSTNISQIPNIIQINGPYFAQPVANASLMDQRNVNGERIMSYQPQNWEKILTYATAFLFVGLIGFLVVRNQPFADPNFVVLVRVLLSVVVAIFGATVPGMLKVELKTKNGLLVRATSALALFVLSFLLTPKVLH